jgi:PTH1 family peptidyl-tRNA hydrolase
MNRMVIALGNNPSIYNGTRHNIGMMGLDHSLKKLGIEWEFDKSLSGWHAKCEKYPTIFFYKPKTFMNICGPNIQNAIKRFEVCPKKSVVIHDDIERKLGKINVKNGGSANGHNGVRSLINSLSTDSIKRIRIGIGKPEKEEVHQWVLGSFTRNELDIIDETVYPLLYETILNNLKH